MHLYRSRVRCVFITLCSFTLLAQEPAVDSSEIIEDHNITEKVNNSGMMEDSVDGQKDAYLTAPIPDTVESTIIENKNLSEEDKNYGIIEKTVNGQKRAYLTAPVPETVEPDANAGPYSSKSQKLFADDISTGLGLSATGALFHFTGLGVWFIGYMRGFNVSSEDEAISVIVQRIIGGSLMAIGPIPACGGANMVHNSANDLIGQSDWNSSWSFYGRGWAFMGISTGIGITGSIIASSAQSSGIAVVTTILNIGLGIAGEAMWIASIVKSTSYIKSYKRQNEAGLLRFRVSPEMDFNGNSGLRLDGEF